MLIVNTPFPSSSQPPFQSKAKCEVFVMKISFSHVEIGTNYHNKHFALKLALKERLRGTRKWPIIIILWCTIILIIIVFVGQRLSNVLQQV